MTRRDEAMQMLDQLENVLIECEKAPRENTPTMKAFIIVLRVCYFLLMDKARDRIDYGKWNEEWTRQ